MPDLSFGPPAAGPAAVRPRKWSEIVHKMVAIYGAPVNLEDEARVVDYLLASRPPKP